MNEEEKKCRVDSVFNTDLALEEYWVLRKEFPTMPVYLQDAILYSTYKLDLKTILLIGYLPVESSTQIYPAVLVPVLLEPALLEDSSIVEFQVAA
jgi:hypothetical protein